MAVTLQTIIHEAHENHLPASVLLTIGEYVPEIGSEIAKYTSEIPDGFSFFGDKEVVKQYLAKGLQTDQHVQKVIDLAKVMIVRRNIGQNAGVSFPIHSQVLALTMEYANNEIVLEVGGGTGEIAAILANCARQLYYIDMNPQCVEKFKQRRLELSKSVRDK